MVRNKQTILESSKNNLKLRRQKCSKVSRNRCIYSLILVIALLFFGPSKLADLGKGLGQGIRGFKDALKDEPAEPKPSQPSEKEE